MTLAAAETAKIPRLIIQQYKLAKRYSAANLELQLREWGYETKSTAIGPSQSTLQEQLYAQTRAKCYIEHRDFIKFLELRQTWMKSLANELGRLAQGIHEIKGTNTISMSY